MGADGPGHKACAIKCASAGIPVLLVEKGTEKSYILLPHKDASAFPQRVLSRMEDEVTVTGKEYNKNGTQFIVVESPAPNRLNWVSNRNRKTATGELSPPENTHPSIVPCNRYLRS